MGILVFQHLEPLYASVWKRTGIYEAIISSTFRFQRDNEVIVGLAEKWCVETNTFVFPWGEATITLDDMMVLGGFSVFGSPVFSSSRETKELKQIEHKLETAKNELCSKIGWIRKFMWSSSDIEHEAFLSLWLERYVFNDSDSKHQARIFSIAIRLAKGEAFALASIYRDIGLLKSTIVAANEFKENENSAHIAITLCCPLHLVQLWAWERFPAFQPFPNAINNGEPRSALWKDLKVDKFKCVRSDLDSAAGKFQWQPYLHGLHLHKLYKKKEQQKHLGIDRDLLAVGLCLRVSELVGLDCIQQYLPHRVARQFGLDQDIPSDIARTDVVPDLAWSNYIRPFSDVEVFVPSHLSKPDVTIRYLEWWNQMGIGSLDRLIKNPIFNPIKRKRSSISRSKRVPKSWIGDPVKSITQADATVEPIKSITQTAAIGTQLNELEEETDTKPRIPSNIAENTNGVRYGGENTDDYSTGIPGLALEARIARLEEVVAKLKAARG